MSWHDSEHPEDCGIGIGILQEDGIVGDVLRFLKIADISDHRVYIFVNGNISVQIPRKVMETLLEIG